MLERTERRWVRLLIILRASLVLSSAAVLSQPCAHPQEGMSFGMAAPRVAAYGAAEAGREYNTTYMFLSRIGSSSLATDHAEFDIAR